MIVHKIIFLFVHIFLGVFRGVLNVVYSWEMLLREENKHKQKTTHWDRDFYQADENQAIHILPFSLPSRTLQLDHTLVNHIIRL